MIALLAVVQMATVSHRFEYVSAASVARVSVAGTFNGWNRDANPMVKGADGKTWTLTLPLAPGVHQYKFVVDGETWVVDPRGKAVSDGNGNTNTELVIVPSDYAQPASPTDGKIATSTLAHTQAVSDLNWDRGKLTVMLTARPDDLSKVEFVVNGQAVPMEELGRSTLTTRYRAQLKWDRATDLRYIFRLSDRGTKFFGPKGVQSTEAEAGSFEVMAKTFQPFEVPNWVEKTVFYQIFPDRFDNGDRTNDPANVVPWDATPTYSNRFGGDLAGVSKHISYLKQLGIGAIYFNPIFWSPSNHRYETKDYTKVDPELGTNDEFTKLTQDLRAAGIRTVLDGVFNHTDTSFFAFDDVVKHGKESPYVDWYRFKSFPVKVGPDPNYEAWFNYPSMPKLNVLAPGAKEYLLKVPMFWQDRAAIAGWRLDVANEVPQDYWRAFRKVVKARDPETWIVGEHWGDSRPWLGGDQWDAAMNYPFREAVLQLLGKGRSGKPSECMNRLMTTYSWYAPQVSRNMMNLLDSHDTPRILTEVGGDKDLAMLAAVLQFTWVGAPCIYYGDELGMEGGTDPDNRRGMRWDLMSLENPTLIKIAYLAEIRNRVPVLQSGDPIALVADDDAGTLAYGRALDDELAIVMLNRSDSSRTITVKVPPQFHHLRFLDALSRKEARIEGGKLSFVLPAREAAILLPQSGATSRSRPDAHHEGADGPRPSLNVHRST